MKSEVIKWRDLSTKSIRFYRMARKNYGSLTKEFKYYLDMATTAYVIFSGVYDAVKRLDNEK